LLSCRYCLITTFFNPNKSIHMKKIIALLFFLSFTQMSMSQDLTKDFKLFAKKDLEILKTVVSVSIEQEQPILDFFYKKYKQYSIYSLTVDRKKEIALEYEQELKLLIYPNEVSKLEKNSKVLKKLVSE
jgi:hypothetical protein